MSDRTRCITTACQTHTDGPRPTQARKHLCLDCERTTRRHLAHIAADWHAAHRSLHPSTTNGDDKVNGSRTTPVPVDLDVADILRRTKANIWFLVRLVVTERELDVVQAGDRTVPELCAWLTDRDTDHVGWLAGHDDALLVASVTDDLAADARSVAWATTPLRARRITIPGVRCTEHGTSDLGERVECTGTLYALVGNRDGLPDLHCSVDRAHVIDPATWTSRGFNRRIDPGAAVNLRHAIVGS